MGLLTQLRPVPEPLPPAGIWIRLGADLVDSLLLNFISCGIVALFLGTVYGFRVLLGTAWMTASNSVAFFGELDPFLLQSILGVTRVVLACVYYTNAIFRYGTTLGKKCFCIEVLSLNGQPVSFKASWIRCVGYCASYLPFGGGFLMTFFHPEKRALHDLLAGTRVVFRPSN